MDSSTELKLLQKNAPLVWIHADEDANPSSIDWYLERVSMVNPKVLSLCLNDY